MANECRVFPLPVDFFIIARTSPSDTMNKLAIINWIFLFCRFWLFLED